MQSTGKRRSCRVRTLIVDDSAPIAHLITGLLEGHGLCEVVGMADNGQEAIEIVAALRPDLVIMDVQMPKMNGIDATRIIKSRPGAPHVVVITFDHRKAYEDAAYGAGADGFCSKEDIAEQLPPLLRKLFPPSSKNKA